MTWYWSHPPFPPNRWRSPSRTSPFDTRRRRRCGNISLDIQAEALVAVTGPVGSGKSALARALLALYPLDSGQVLLDGDSLEEIPAAQRAVRTGYLPQDPYLFFGSVRGNILPGSAATESARSQAILQAAASWAALEADLGTFSAGLATEIGELGVRVLEASATGSRWDGPSQLPDLLHRGFWSWTIRFRPWPWTPKQR